MQPVETEGEQNKADETGEAAESEDESGEQAVLSAEIVAAVEDCGFLKVFRFGR